MYTIMSRDLSPQLDNLPDNLMFVPPPSELGALRFAHSTVRSDKPDRTGTSSAILIGALCCLLSFAPLLSLLAQSPGPLIYAAIALVLLIVGPSIAYACWPYQEVWFVGENGVFVHRQKGKRVMAQTVLFDESLYLLCNGERTFTGKHANGTVEPNFSFFRDGKRLLKVETQGAALRTLFVYPPLIAFALRRDCPDMQVTYRFGRCAERALSDFLMPQLEQKLERGESVEFSAVFGKTLRVSREQLTVLDKQGEKSLSLRELAEVEVKGDDVRLKLATGPEKASVFYKFPYYTLRNTGVLLALLAKRPQPQVQALRKAA